MRENVSVGPSSSLVSLLYTKGRSPIANSSFDFEMEIVEVIWRGRGNPLVGLRERREDEEDEGRRERREMDQIPIHSRNSKREVEWSTESKIKLSISSLLLYSKDSLELSLFQSPPSPSLSPLVLT